LIIGMSVGNIRKMQRIVASVKRRMAAPSTRRGSVGGDAMVLLQVDQEIRRGAMRIIPKPSATHQSFHVAQ